MDFGVNAHRGGWARSSAHVKLLLSPYCSAFVYGSCRNAFACAVENSSNQGVPPCQTWVCATAVLYLWYGIHGGVFDFQLAASLAYVSASADDRSF